MNEDSLIATVVVSSIVSCGILYFVGILHRHIQQYLDAKRRIKEQQEYLLQII